MHKGGPPVRVDKALADGDGPVTAPSLAAQHRSGSSADRATVVSVVAAMSALAATAMRATMAEVLGKPGESLTALSY
jgi:hypothetical protein